MKKIDILIFNQNTHFSSNLYKEKNIKSQKDPST